MSTAISIVYIIASIGLLLYGLNCYVLLALYLRKRDTSTEENSDIIAGAESVFAQAHLLPVITTQIPLYNEANCAERSLRSVAAIDYPKNKHEIQVLDDSTDETRFLVDSVAEDLRSEGHWVTVFRRNDRKGFKAGALAAALKNAHGEYIAIFDADFVPPAHFFRHSLPFFFKDSKLALVQGRWGHLNREESALTRAQAIGIDGHFMVEQTARAFNGLFMNFNGTAGIWRRVAIEKAGGWSADTLTEDLDLAYRVQLLGWRMRFVSHLEVPGELPTSVSAFKSQQFRWAKGSMQTACKLMPTILRSKSSLWMKVQAFLHLTHYAIHPLMLVVSILALPMMLHLPWNVSPGVMCVIILSMLLSLFAPSSMYLVSQRALYPKWWRGLFWMPALMCVGVGLALSNSFAIFQALTGHKSDFIRTPKKGSRSRKNYKVATPVLPLFEIALGLYCAFSFVIYFYSDRYAIGPFLLLYSIGFTSIGLFGLMESRGDRGPLLRPLKSAVELPGQLKISTEQP